MTEGNFIEQEKSFPSRKYFCEYYTETPLGLQKYQLNRIYLGLAHVFGAFGLFKLYTLQYPILVPTFS